jgi:hypothetical protein
MPIPLLKLTRQVHLYLGVFIAPMLLFFAFTGAVQTLGLHEPIAGTSYHPPAWLATLGHLHKKQNIDTPVFKEAKPAPSANAKSPSSPGSEAKTSAVKPTPKPQWHIPMKVFFLIVSLGLFTSTLTGIYMAYKYNSNSWVVSGLLLAGIVIPIAALPF